jgi:hypothetical protein
LNVAPEGIEPEPVAVVVATVFPSYVTVIAELGTKFEPDTVTDVLTGPLDGERVIAGTVTVKVAEAELPRASVALTVLPPVVEGGTVNVSPENEPVVLVITVAGVVDIPAPLYVNVISEFAAKP